MEKWIPIIWIVGGGMGILAVTLFIDKLKSKIKKTTSEQKPTWQRYFINGCLT